MKLSNNYNFLPQWRPNFVSAIAPEDRCHLNGVAMVNSKIRETAIFGNLPISDQFEQLKCGVAVVDLSTRQMVSLLEFQTGIDEIYDVQVAPFPRTIVSSPHAVTDSANQIWSLPAS